ncbi:MAG: hypothetical protein CMI54_05600 [Parcubacteria group bacterium]|jgi:hypothetical protein|nr:hypothetical protein [Parcubacteria group bacterium]|tara:strand:- start:1669 stop:3870 length:2202 start_codon:yes stop_codon:yes gene_type:complete
MLENIPQELRDRNQWVYAGPGKSPFNARTHKLASPTDPSTWSTFAEAVASGQPVGYVLSAEDPYCFIDLDTPTENEKKIHSQVFRSIDTYKERSISGKGVHMIVRGAIPKGVRRDHIEVYSDSRYMICTGDVLKNSPIADGNELVNNMFSQMGGNDQSADLIEGTSVYTLEELWEVAHNAANGDKFDKLFNGDWKSDYESQSEADYALMSMFAFYSRDNAQCREIFRLSDLGKREKAQRDDYLNYALQKFRAQQPALVDMGDLKDMVSLSVKTPMESCSSASQAVQTVAAEQEEALVFPPGLVGDVARYILSAAKRPVPEVALAGAIAYVAGICGRAYNISETGLNQYIILLADTGSGKEGAGVGIDKIVAACQKTIPQVIDFQGPGTFASGQALIRHLDVKPCFYSVLGEFGLTLQQMCDINASPAQVMLKKALLDLYSKSGFDRILTESVYSDSDKNTKCVKAPNVSIFGEATPETFFAKLSASHIAEGLIPRFLMIHYTGKRPEGREDKAPPPDKNLIQSMNNLYTVAIGSKMKSTYMEVDISPEAKKILKAFDKFADVKINEGKDLNKQLWNRAHLKALKLAGLIAVGVNMHNPVVDPYSAQWAVDFVKKDCEIIDGKFARGEVGTGEHNYEPQLRKIVEDYLEMTPEQRLKAKGPKDSVEHKVVPFSYIRKRAKKLSSFQNDRRGSTLALKLALDDLVEANVLQKMDPVQSLSLSRQRIGFYYTGNQF